MGEGGQCREGGRGQCREVGEGGQCREGGGGEGSVEKWGREGSVGKGGGEGSVEKWGREGSVVGGGGERATYVHMYIPS